MHNDIHIHIHANALVTNACTFVKRSCGRRCGSAAALRWSLVGRRRLRERILEPDRVQRVTMAKRGQRQPRVTRTSCFPCAERRASGCDSRRMPAEREEHVTSSAQSDLVLLFACRLPGLTMHNPRAGSSPSCRHSLLVRATAARGSSSRRSILLAAVAVWVLANPGFAVAVLEQRKRGGWEKGRGGSGVALHMLQIARECESAGQIVVNATPATRKSWATVVLTQPNCRQPRRRS